MKITTTFLKEIESLIATGETGAAMQKLLSVAEETGYKSDVLTMSSRWNRFSREQMNGTLSQEAQTLRHSKINSDLLLLIEALGRELSGEKVVPNIITADHKKSDSNPLFKTYIPILLTALAVWAISYFAYQKSKPDCEAIINLAGEWKVHRTDNPDDEIGVASIRQTDCLNSFEIRSEIKSAATGEDVDFNSKIGGITNGEVFFVYENFDGEMGICRGIAPNENQTDFTVHCIDLVGYDKNNETKMGLIFKWDTYTKE